MFDLLLRNYIKSLTKCKNMFNILEKTFQNKSYVQLNNENNKLSSQF